VLVETFGKEKDKKEGHLGGASCSITRVNMIDLVVEDDMV